MAQGAARPLLAALTAVYGPGRETTYTVDKIVGAALAGKTARIAPLADWPYVYVDDAAAPPCGLLSQKAASSSAYFVAHPERVTPDDIAAAAAAAGKPVRVEIDSSKPKAARGPLDVEPPRATSAFARKSVIAREFAA